MQRWKLLLLVGVVAGVVGPGVAVAGDQPVIARTQATWQVLSLTDQRFLTLMYETGGCRQGNASATVRETSRRIRIAVEQDEVVAVPGPDPRPVCPQNIGWETFTVELQRSVAGRLIVGGPRLDGLARDPFPGPALEVADLAKRDSVAALHLQGFKVRTIGRRSGVVAFQSPLPGKTPPDGRVRLTIGRNLFPARRIKGCLERAGQRVRIARPEPGDLDAPDVEFVLSEPSPGAFVALYADPLRAKELASSLRRNARRFHGTFERHGRLAIVWVKHPDPLLAERIRSCISRGWNVPS